MKPLLSVIMQSTLRDYPGAATHRPAKLRRAIESVLMQTTPVELVVVADRCEQTAEICSEYPITCIVQQDAPKHAKWVSGCRNIGRKHAKGQYIAYLDNDDFYLKGYAACLTDQIQRDLLAWYLVDHLEYKGGKWFEKRVSLVANSAGTANIIHRADIAAMWPNECHYGSEDWAFIRRIMGLNLKHRDVNCAGYCIAHIRGRYDI